MKYLPLLLLFAGCYGGPEFETPPPEFPVRSNAQCHAIVNEWCDWCAEDRCRGWTVYAGICSVSACISALEDCPSEWPDSCKGSLDPVAINDCDV